MSSPPGPCTTRGARWTSLRGDPESVQGSSLPLEGVHYVHRSHSFAACVLGVRHRISNDSLKKDLEHTAGLLVNHPAQAFYSAATSKPFYCGFGDALDVIAQSFAVALGPAFSKSFSTFSATRHT